VVLSLRFPHQNPVHASPLPHMRYTSIIIIIIIIIMKAEIIDVSDIWQRIISCGH
jgi:hypothetical protein